MLNLWLPLLRSLLSRSTWMPWLSTWIFVLFNTGSDSHTASRFVCILQISYPRYLVHVSPLARPEHAPAMSSPLQLPLLWLQSISTHWLWCKTPCTSKFLSELWWHLSNHTATCKECCFCSDILRVTMLDSRRPSCRNTTDHEAKSIFICHLINK